METTAPLKVIFVILGSLLFLIAGVLWFLPVDREPTRTRLIALGLFFWCASTLLKG